MGGPLLLCSFVVADSVGFGSIVINQFVLRFYHFSLGIYPYRGLKLSEVRKQFLKTQFFKENEFLAYQSYLKNAMVICQKSIISRQSTNISPRRP